jgi:trehalose 2-sulfotransferase
MVSEMKRGYVICGYARSGSTLLRGALLATGKLGDPQEYFNPRAIAVGNGEIYPKDACSQITEIAKRGSTGNGVYGLKVFCDQFDALHGYDWAGQLPNLHFVHLERRDTLGQAISWVRAIQSGQWDSDQPFRGQLKYDEHAIAAALNKFSYDRARWASFFARNGIRPLNLVYEEMIDAIPRTVQAIGELVGVADLPVELLQAKKLEVLRDSLSDEWRSRFVASKRDCSVLDKPRSEGPNKWLRGLFIRS